MAGHDDRQVEKWSTGDEADAAHKRIRFRSHLPQQTGGVEAKRDATDTSRARDHTKYQTYSAVSKQARQSVINGYKSSY